MIIITGRKKDLIVTSGGENISSQKIESMLLNYNEISQAVIYGDGKQTRCFSFIQDVLSCLMTACLDDEPLGNVINVGPDEEIITINQLSEKICELTNFRGVPEFLPARPQEVKHAVCSSNKARKILDYGTKVNLEDGLKSMVQYIEKRGVSKFNRHIPVEIISDLTPKTWISDRMNQKSSKPFFSSSKVIDLRLK